MTSSLRIRRPLLASGVLLITTGLLLVAGVIPSIYADRFPRATPRSAALACWYIVAASLFAAFVFAGTAFRKVRAGWRWRMLVGFVAILPLLFGVALTDGAMAFQGHGPEMKTASALMFTCAGGEFLAGAFALVAAFLRSDDREPA